MKCQPLNHSTSIIANTPPNLLVDAHGSNPSLISQLTCWGDGTLNFSRSSKESIRAVLATALAAGDINRLLNARKKDPTAQLGDLLDALEFTPTQRDRVEPLLNRHIHLPFLMDHQPLRRLQQV